MKEKVSILNQRMLLVMKQAIDSGLADNQGDFSDKIGFNYTNLGKVKKGLVGFTAEQIKKACEITGANANWILGLEKNIMRTAAKEPLKLMREALESLEAEALAKKNKG